MKICITGAGGFIGSHLAERVVQEDHEAVCLVRYNSRTSWGWLDQSAFKDSLSVVSGDIRDYDSVKGALEGCDMVFHLAALIGIPYSYISPLAYVKTNVEGTYNVLQAARDGGNIPVVHTSTSEVYGTAQYVPIDEKHPVNPQSPYSASKASADFLALSYHRSFDLPVTVIRPFNTYGPRQSARAIIPTVITQILAGRKDIRLGNLAPTRDLNFVEDTVSGFLSAGLGGKGVGEVINLGTGKEITIGSLVEKIASLCNASVEIISDEKRLRPEKSEVERLCADAGKAKAILGWQPSITLDEGLKKTITWIEKNMDLFKTGTYAV